MANGIKIEVKGLDSFIGADVIVYEAIKDCMDDIRDDLLILATGLAPVDSGKLEKSVSVRRSYNNKKGCSFTISFKAENKGFDYATWTDEADYNLGKKSAEKPLPKSRFAKGSLQVGKGYASNSVDISREGWDKFIKENIDRKLTASLRTKSRKNKTFGK